MLKRIDVTGEQYEQLLREMARLACGAYYRGHFQGNVPTEKLESFIKAAVDVDAEEWKPAARAYLSLAGVLID